ncbi:MAG: Abi family protein [Chitinispirillia bacterium]|nr:Abi family protein [Chitinispirillia bacterium]MCL2242527.1 Abi family protein [Chitinispirillia bacterium]
MKQPKTISEQIELLKSRNLIINDEIEAAQFLSKNNYYRLSGYWRKYQIDPDNSKDLFIAGTTFEMIANIYELDAQLRNLLQKGIGIFEICFRSKFAYCMAHSKPNGQLTYMQQDSYSNKVSKNENIGDLLIKINEELSRSNEKYIKHYKEKNEDIPIWAAVEILSFSTVSKMYSRWLDKNVAKETIRNYKIFKDYDGARRIIRSLVYLRNLCAHQARIWNRETIVQVVDKQLLQQFGHSKERAQWRIISILMLLLDEINLNNGFSNEVLNLCKQNDDFYNGLIEPSL